MPTCNASAVVRRRRGRGDRRTTINTTRSGSGRVSWATTIDMKKKSNLTTTVYINYYFYSTSYLVF
jgi:hypothetical protein